MAKFVQLHEITYKIANIALHPMATFIELQEISCLKLVYKIKGKSRKKKT
jgi:hypothetical protein